MKSARLLRIIGEVDEGFVDTAPMEEHTPKKRPIVWIRWVSLAACLALVVSGTSGYIYHITANNQNILYPTDNIPYKNPDNAGTMRFSSVGVQDPYTYNVMATKADMIVVADVVSVEEGSRTLFCRNYAYVSVLEILKGNAVEDDTLCIADPTSGFYSNSGGDPMMQSGNRVLLFLVKTELTRLSSQGEELAIYQFIREYPSVGKFFYDRDEKYHNVHSYGNYPPFFFERVYADSEPKTLEEIKKLISLTAL